jgi:hypothetical protein
MTGDGKELHECAADVLPYCLQTDHYCLVRMADTQQQSSETVGYSYLSLLLDYYRSLVCFAGDPMKYLKYLTLKTDQWQGDGTKVIT